MTINWIMPMAGKGTRTSKLGDCKPAIKILDKTIFSWCISGMKKHISSKDNIFAVTTKYFEKEFNIESLLKKTLLENEISASLKLIKSSKTPNGPADSVYKTKDFVDKEKITIVINPDQFCDFEIPKSSEDWDAFMPLYVNDTGDSSYAIIENNKIIKVEEKILISNYASAGIYGFKKGKLLFDFLEKVLNKKPHKNGEYFIGPIFSEIANNGFKIIPKTVFSKYDLGSIDNINIFKNFIKSI